MNRRQILSISLCSAVLPLSGCFTARLHEDTYYWEKLKGVFISNDKQTLVIIGAKYHYILEAPPAILAALDPMLHSSISSARFDSFVVDGDNKMTGIVTLDTSNELSEVQKRYAKAAGFRENGSYNLIAKVPIHGARYQAKPLRQLTEEKLNKEHFVSIKELPSISETARRIAMTPVSVAADGALVLGVIILSPLWIPILLGGVKNIHK